MVKSNWKRYKKIGMLTILCFSTLFLLYYFDRLKLDILIGKDSQGMHYNLITINSVLSGFMFTSLSLILSMTNTKTIKKLEQSKYMDSIYDNISIGIITSLISIALSLIMIFVIPDTPHSYIGNILIPFIELLSLIITIGCFMLSIFDVKLIIKHVRKDIVKSKIPQDEIDKVLKKYD